MKSFSINITRTNSSKLSTVDFDNIPFGKVVSDHMFEVDYINGEWVNPQIRPVEKLAIHPANLALHYGQSIFEGMKATKGKSGVPLFFRPMEHVIRLNESADRMNMPRVPADLFEEAIHQLVYLEKDWIPPQKGCALYIRPVMFAMDEFIGVRSSDTFKFIIFTMPVGPYYPKPVSLKVEEKFVRAAEGGVGAAKTAGNYAASLYPSRLANEEGYDQVMWMDAREFKYVQEVGTMNIFFVIDGTVVTPRLSGTILKGITRDSIIKILRDKEINVEERDLSIDEILQASNDGKLQEVFGTGTAAVVIEVNRLGYRGNDYHLDTDEFKISKMVKTIINDLRAEELEDKFGWVVPAKELVQVD